MTFRDELCSLINRHSKENGSNTPDFILAEYLTDCLHAFDKAVTRRTQWYSGDAGATYVTTNNRGGLPDGE